MTGSPGRAVVCAGAVVTRADGRIVAVQRGHPPSAGAWSIPGGRVEAGETLAEAAVREVREETGLSIEVLRELGRTTLPGPGDDVYDVTDFLAAVVGDAEDVRAGDDAADVRWVTRDELAELPTSPGLLDHLDSWGVWS